MAEVWPDRVSIESPGAEQETVVDVGRGDRSGTPQVRHARPGDAEAMAAIYAPWVRDTRVSLEVEPPSAEEMADRVSATQPRWPWLVACDGGGRVLGYAYGGTHRARRGYRWTVEVSAYVDASAHRRGVGRRLYTALLGLLGAQGHRQVVAGIGLPNDASVAFHESLGFHHVGTFTALGRKFDDWQDVGWWQRGLGESEGSTPREPRGVDELSDAVLDEWLG